MSDCYYSLIRRGLNGRVFGWIPDLPGVLADGTSEEAVIRDLSANARECLGRIVAKALPVPPATSGDDLPRGDHVGRYRRLLLVL
ncbi:MAG: hypothetical protein WCP68_23085 [Enhydrobacter sp.]